MKQKAAVVERHPIAAEIELRMRAAGYRDMKTLSLAAGLGETYVRDLLVGRTLNPKQGELMRIAEKLGCTFTELMRPILSKAPERSLEAWRAARFRAARWACWEDRAVAARWLEIDVQLLEKIEKGEAPLSDDLVRRFCVLTGCPLAWIQQGSMSGMPPEMAARVGFSDPSLLPDSPQS